MPDICDLVLDEHEEFRRRFAEMDEMRASGAEPEKLGRVWGPLAEKLELHASTEESVFYPALLEKGRRGQDETNDAINDHNEIRDALRRASHADVGSEPWWDAVLGARASNSDHMAEEEREAVPDFRTSAEPDDKERLGAEWIDFEKRHPGARGLDTRNKDADSYIARNT